MVSLCRICSQHGARTAIPMFRTLDNRSSSGVDMFSIIVSLASASGSCASSNLKMLVFLVTIDSQSPYIAAAAADAFLRCCHRRSRGSCVDGDDCLNGDVRTDEEAHLRHIHDWVVGLYKLAAALLERCIKRDALISTLMKKGNK